MTTVELGAEGAFRVQLTSREDAVALRVALKATDGADQVDAEEGADLSLDLENPFNAFALWLAGFDMSHSAQKAVLDAVAPIAWAHMGIHTRGFQKMSMRQVREMQRQKEPPKGPDA